MEDTNNYAEFFAILRPRFAEREFRLMSSALAKCLPRGGISFVANISGLSRPTLYNGMRELEDDLSASSVTGRQRKVGGGRKTLLAGDPTLEKDLLRLVSPHEPGQQCVYQFVGYVFGVDHYLSSDSRGNMFGRLHKISSTLRFCQCLLNFFQTFFPDRIFFFIIHRE
jgi:hypothetical protein